MDQIKGPPPLRLAPPALLLVLLAVAGFLPAIVNRPISDDMLLVESRLALDGVSSFATFFRENYWGEWNPGGTYRPLSLCLLGLQKLVFGMNLGGYRVVSLLLHAVCTLLVWHILGRMLRAGSALFGAALFACHPIHAECVITVYGQIDLWSALFFWLFRRISE